MPIMRYQLQQQALMPLVAATYALNFGLSYAKRWYGSGAVAVSRVHAPHCYVPRPCVLRSYAEQTLHPAGAEKQLQVLLLCCAVKPLGAWECAVAKRFVRRLHKYYLIPQSHINRCLGVGPPVSWHAERVASIGRERCGGQGYLACNGFAAAIAGAHSGITAEGDNRVLWQKVTKELLGMYAKGTREDAPRVMGEAEASAVTDVMSEAWLAHCFHTSENVALEELASRMQAHVAGGASVFEAWM